ncbi:hypothetical protein [Bradyrhizobium sp. Tv2a-2]|uniref:hypothetical protein n=1 Tax=Bradyrhizobium sp. Tv2a-2 TaxID=113395 RepID=UPI0004097155|nr:hypothetical protein [Bradyrhizobium sp. Tv2a-2]
MKKSTRYTAPQATGDNSGRAILLAERMAAILTDEDASDAATAIAYLTAGVISHYGYAIGDLVSCCAKFESSKISSWQQ